MFVPHHPGTVPRTGASGKHRPALRAPSGHGTAVTVMPPSPTPISSVCVFCGSRFGADPAFAAAAAALGRGLAQHGLHLVYGGGRIGLMGAVADAALDAGGAVTGIIPEFLRTREIAHGNVGELVVTPNMHDRKRRMFELSDAFVVMPGGLGTMDEFFEILTWRQLALHDKPILVCDIAGWGTTVAGLVEALVGTGFADGSALDLFEVLPDVPSVLARLAGAETPAPAAPAARL